MLRETMRGMMRVAERPAQVSSDDFGSRLQRAAERCGRLRESQQDDHQLVVRVEEFCSKPRICGEFAEANAPCQTLTPPQHGSFGS